MKQLTQAMINHFGEALTTLATCWKITRRDGTVLGFTDHDRTLPIDGINYLASSGYYRTAIANSATVAVDNLEVRGFLDNDLISELELRNGAYDFAEVEIFAVNWKNLSQGICRLRYGYFGEVQLRSSGLFVVELRGLMQLFSQTVGETITPDCRADLGDHRCKVELIPEVRRSSRQYSSNSRVLVPMDVDTTSINLPFQNANFDWYQNNTYFDWWTSQNAMFTNFPDEPLVPPYYVRPTGPTGWVQRPIWMNPRTNAGPTMGFPNRFVVGYNARALENGWQVGGLLEITQRHGLFGLVVTVHHTLEIPYQDIHTFFGWHRREVEFEIANVNLHPDVNAFRLTLRWRRNPIVDPDDGPAQVQIDNPDLIVNLVPFDDPYLKFSTPNPSVVNTSPFWGGQTNPGNVNLLPAHGTKFLSRSVWLTTETGASNQLIDIIDAGAKQIEVDAGNYRLNCRVVVGAYDWGSAYRVRAFFKNASGQNLATASTGYVPARPSGEWLEGILQANVPPLTRSIRIALDAQLTAERQGDGTAPRIAFDNIDAELRHIDSGLINFSHYGGVEYRAISGGTTASEQPGTFTHTLGETINDGSVQWQAVAPVHTFLAEVDEVFSHTEFTLPSINAPDNWFRWGVLTFLDGANVGRGIECVSWNNSTKRMTLMLPALMPIEPGAMISVHAGCDKTRGSGGCNKFGNILNFRGEPDVPGTDQYFKVGGTGKK